MSGSLWSLRAAELLARTASADPTPGGGSVAAMTGALGVGLVEMAVAVTADASLQHHASRLRALRKRVAAAADSDVEEFDAVMAAHRLPRGGDDDARRRREAIEVASTAATEGPLALASALVEALDVTADVEPVVKTSIVSDVLAGRDLIIGSARAAIRTADTNLHLLDRLTSARAPDLRARRDELVRRLGPVS